MEIGVIGISHKQTPVTNRNAVAFTESKKIQFIDFLLNNTCALEVVILSTCNRSEIYFASDNILLSLEEVKKLYMEFFNVPHLEPYIFGKINDEAIRYLLTVTSGLDSIILGEDQVLCQVKEAYELASQIRGSKKFLNHIFLEAITFAKKMKTKYKISENPLSISSVAIKLLAEVYTNLLSAKILIIGAGMIGQLCLKYLQDVGVKQLYMCNRTMCKLQENLEESEFLKFIPYEERYDHIKDMDIIICATSSPHVVLKEEKMPLITKETIFVDLAVPMDIDRKISEQKDVKIYNIDDFKNRKEQNIQKRVKLSNIIKDEIEGKVIDIEQWIHKTKVDPIIASLHDICSQSQMDTMNLIRKNMNMSPKEYIYIEKIMKSALNRVIREPIKQLKQLETEEEVKNYKKVIHQLFDF